MRLWTWQNPNVLPTKGKYDSLKYSDYINNRPKSERERFITAYREVWKRLGKTGEKITILWCYTDENEAKNPRILSNQNKILWEIDVPEEHIQYICNVAWHWILYGNGCVPPTKFEHFYRVLTNGPFHRNQFNKDFNAEWRMMPEDALWDILFLDNLVEACSDAIVEHPIKKDWLIKKFNFSEVLWM